jgi:hypothetical protein
VRTTGIVLRVYEGKGRRVSAHISRDSRVTSAMRSDAVGGQGGSPASRLRSGTTRAVMSVRWFVMLKGNENSRYRDLEYTDGIAPRFSGVKPDGYWRIISIVDY